MASTQTIAIVGASLAGLRAAETLRTGGFDGTVTLIGSEPHLPYDRPPLSKKVLSGEWDVDRIILRKPDAYADLGLDFRLGQAASGLDLDQRAVVLADGSSVRFDGCIIATGAHCRRLPDQPSLAGIHELRTLDDSLRLHTALKAATNVCVIGAGFIGAEVAATARQMGRPVTIVEAMPVPLLRGLGPQMGPVCASIHNDHGVDLRLGIGVDGFLGAEHVEGVRLADGSVVTADVVVVGIGAAPTTGWLDDSGLTLRDGVVCDRHLSTGAAAVYAAGDLTRWPNEFLGEEVRVEHWSNASEQGAHAAQNLLAELNGSEREAYAALPFFWSDQYDRRIQFLGRAHPDDRTAVVVGSVDDRSFVATYERDGHLVAVLGMNQPRATMGFRKLLLAHAPIEEANAHAAGL